MSPPVRSRVAGSDRRCRDTVESSELGLDDHRNPRPAGLFQLFHESVAGRSVDLVALGGVQQLIRTGEMFTVGSGAGGYARLETREPADVVGLDAERDSVLSQPVQDGVAGRAVDLRALGTLF
jgi:hypothetical protein